jgi:putative ABC transport system substrate-binding protein
VSAQLKRREFITLLGGVGATWPLAVRAQQRHVPTVGILNYASAQDLRVIQFLHALRDLGYVEGRNLALIQQHADGVLDRLPQLAAELVAAKVDLIIALGPAVWAAKQATTAIPIPRDRAWWRASRALEETLLVSRICPAIWPASGSSCCAAHWRNAAVSPPFTTPRKPATTLELEETAAAARALGVTLQPVAARYADELEQAFASAERTQAEGLLVFTHGFAVLNRARIMELAARQRLPVMYGWREFVEEGGLMSYGPDIQILVRQAAIYVDRILRGEKPSNLPVQQPTRLELIINLKTAKALGLEMPPTLLARADEVIE